MTGQQSRQPPASLARAAEQQNDFRQSTSPQRIRLFEPIDIWYTPQVLLTRMRPGIAFADRAQYRPAALWSPLVELEYRDDSFVITAELPGLALEDIKVEIIGNVLILQGERRRDPDAPRHTIRRTERRYGYFYREIVLPDGTDTERVRAEFENGILRVTVPLAQNTRVVPINNVSRGSSSGKETLSTRSKERTHLQSWSSGL